MAWAVVEDQSHDARARQWEHWCRCRVWYFAGYYKYTFLFTASSGITEPESYRGELHVGGTADDIYRFDVKPTMRFDDIIGAREYRLAVKQGVNDIYLLTRQVV